MVERISCVMSVSDETSTPIRIFLGKATNVTTIMLGSGGADAL
ncbi:MAG: hypothetical protein V7776_19450 [Halopseudomonas aestusnigri]